MRKLGFLLLTALAIGSGITSGCRVEHLTSEEARESLEESSVASQAEALTAVSVEISTEFTIGQAVQRAAEQIRSFVESQLPCAEITLSNATLSIEYGAKPGNCTYRGHTFSGTHEISVESNEEHDVIVQHSWDELRNGRVSVTGEATVTWSLEDKSRHIVHELHWTRLSDGRTGTGTGNRTQRALAGGIAEGIEVDGSRAWETDRGRWDLTIDHVQMRWQDPVPQSGAYVLETPFDKTVKLSFERIDEGTISVTASSGDRNIALKINKLGLISRE
jgi:hypothetical protein